LTVVAPGTQTRDFTHIEDIVAGIVLCYEKGSGDGYLLGTGVEHQIVDVAKMYAREYTITPERQGERLSGRADPSKMKELGWVPQHELEDYIAAWVARLNTTALVAK
jgi:UDP-glucose 4-epimerase